MNDKKLQYDELISWIRLIRTNNIGEITFYSLLKLYGNATEVIIRLKDSINNFKTHKKISIFSKSEAEKEFENVTKFGGKFIAFCEPEYPVLLRHIRDAPPIITILGNIKLLNNENNIAIVGSRTATLNSICFAEKISYDLASRGFNIVSGLAKGIDTAGHSVIFKSFPTIAVMATGINICYPYINKYLYEKISSEGLCITEFPFNMYAKAQFFPKRNRIVSGLSKGVLIVEAKKNSGSLITANLAIAQNREVFAVPGFPVDERFSGNNHLLKQGATLVEDVNDIIHSLRYNITYHSESNDLLFDNNNNNNNQNFNHTNIEQIKTIILNSLSFDPINIEYFVSKINFDITLIMISIVELELEGLIERVNYNEIAIKYKYE